MLNVEGLKFFEELVKKSVTPATVQITKNKQLVFDGSNYQIIDREEQPRSASITDLQSLIEATILYGLPSSIWVSFEQILVVLDDRKRREQKIWMDLEPTTQFRKLQELQAGKVFTQAELIYFLRVELAKAGAEDLIATLRRLKWSSTDNGVSTVQHGRASIGRSIESQVTGEAPLPDSWIFQIKMVNESIGSQQSVRVAIEPNPANQTIKLQTIAGEIPDAIELFTDSVKYQISEFIRTEYPEHIDEINLFEGTHED